MAYSDSRTDNKLTASREDLYIHKKMGPTNYMLGPISQTCCIYKPRV